LYSIVEEVSPEHLWYAEDTMTVWRSLEHFFTDPFPNFHYHFLMTGRAEVSVLTPEKDRLSDCYPHGGPHVSFCAKETLKGLPELDMVVCGEEEETLLELVCAGQNGNAWSQINGIVFRKEGKTTATPKRDLITDLRRLPAPAF
jgi:hypothetical protein